jgi:hypothetical protein
VTFQRVFGALHKNGAESRAGRRRFDLFVVHFLFFSLARHLLMDR